MWNESDILPVRVKNWVRNVFTLNRWWLTTLPLLKLETRCWKQVRCVKTSPRNIPYWKEPHVFQPGNDEWTGMLTKKLKKKKKPIRKSLNLINGLIMELLWKAYLAQAMRNWSKAEGLLEHAHYWVSQHQDNLWISLLILL